MNFNTKEEDFKRFIDVVTSTMESQQPKFNEDLLPSWGKIKDTAKANKFSIYGFNPQPVANTTFNVSVSFNK